MADKTTTELLASLRAVLEAWDRHYLPLQSPGAEADHNGPIAEARRAVLRAEFDQATRPTAATNHDHDLSTTEGRTAALAALGPEEYARAHQRYRESQVVATVNGYKIRRVPSRYGTFYVVEGAPDMLAATKHLQLAAEGLAQSLPAGPHSGGEV